MPLPPNIQSFVDNVYAQGAVLPEDIQTHRREWQATLTSLNRPRWEVGNIQEIFTGHTKLRIYTPSGTGPFPLFIYYPGGAFVYSDLDSHDSLCRNFCAKNEYIVVNVKTRVAPEHTPQESLEDAYEALLWCIKHATEIESCPDSIILGGDSSGGNFAALIAIRAANDKLENVKGQLLIVPATDLARTGESHKIYDKGYLLDRVDWFYNFYLSHNSPHDPLISPLYATIPQNTAPARIVFATYDPLADDARLYAAHLKAAGIEAIITEVPVIHGMHLFEQAIDTSSYPTTAIGNTLISELEEFKAYCPILKASCYQYP